MPAQTVLTPLIEQLGDFAFFHGLDRPALTELARHARWRECAAGEVVYLEGEAAAGLYLLRSGWLKIVKTSPEGREQVLRFVGPDEIFSEIGIFAHRPNPATAMAMERAGMWLLPQAALVQLLHNRPDVAVRVMENLADRVLSLVNLVADLSLRTVTGRLARLLLDGAAQGVLHRPRWYTQAELAARLGTVPDVVQRAMRGLEADGVIEVERHRIRIRDQAALDKIAA